MELTKTDVTNILILLFRVTVKSGEARDYVAVCDKLNGILEQGAEENEQ